jgi:hypothetical protein
MSPDNSTSVSMLPLPLVEQRAVLSLILSKRSRQAGFTMQLPFHQIVQL